MSRTNIDDCSSIECLKLGFVSFSESINELVLKQLALKFKNLKQLQCFIYGRCDSRLLLFWKHLTPIIVANNTLVELKTSHFFFGNEFDRLTKAIEQEKLAIDKIEIDIHNLCWDLKFKYIKKLIVNPNLKYLIISTIDK